ncbi:alpha/beta hydrolase [Oceanotoga teriensis]|jgi:pimeloyl-ACP methyl ester carboxylesterase|uniref:alpha/beta hydrolase n=1 Tax=Oceanotoga teriensis TaxID=515440 RepID=UPI0027125633|nr:alpha/beta hydrolase [Oceanotoga teriensis]MDO7977761.1 alpha/beta hydrolase [Oceanotoga teriensis]
MIYDYEKTPVEYSIKSEQDYEVYKFKAVYNEEHYKENNYQYVHVFEPYSNIKGDIIFVHGIGPRNIEYLEWYARYFRENGFRTSVVILPYHLNRKPSNMIAGDPFYSSEPEECVKLFHNSVKDIRRTIDLIECFKGYKKDKLYLMGVSFGGIIGTMSLALDKRIKKGILMITGGNWRWINFYSPYTQRVRDAYEKYGNSFGCRNEESCIKYRKDALSLVKKNISSIEDIFNNTPITCYHYDPLSYAKFVNQDVLFIRGIFDKIIPQRSTDELIELLPNKKVKKIPTGHKTSILFKKIVGSWVINYLEKY